MVLFRRVEADGIQVLQIGGWPAPFGITLVADLLAAMLVVAVGVVGVAVTAAAFAGVDPRREAFGYHPLIQILLMGVAGAFLTGDLFNLYVWFEVMLVASFVLMALHRTSAQVEAAFKYVTINLIASSIFLTALGLLYGAAGTLNMADLARIWPTIGTPGIDMVLAVLFVMAFSIKAGLFPLFFWLPASYHTPPAAIGAAFAGLLTKVGVYALMRIFTLLFQGAPPPLFTLLLVMSAATMVIGLVAALNERDFRRILSFNLVGHIGYTTASLSVMTPAALAGAIFYVLHHIVVITNLFLVSGVLLRLRRTTDMTGLGGLYRSQPLFSALAMVPIFSLAGVPPLSGFLGKLAILEGTFAGGRVLGGRHRSGGWTADPAVDGAHVVGCILETGGDGARPGHARHAAPGRDLGPEPRDARDHVRRRTAVRAHVTRGASVAAARRVHPGGAGRYAVTCSSEASSSRLPGRRCKGRSRSPTCWPATSSATSSSRCWPGVA